MKRIIIVIPFFIFFACSNNNNVNNTQVDKIDEDTSQNQIVEEFVYVPDSLDIYFDYPIDFYALKKNIGEMDSSGDIKLENKYFHQVEDSTYVYYNYNAFTLDLEIENIHNRLVFKTIKPWATSEDRYYKNDNEILVGIRSCLQWDGLDQSNFVSLPDSVIYNRFGAPDTIVSDCYVYVRNDKLLSLKMSNHKVTWFKYFWLEESFSKNFEIKSEFVNFYF
jgi:hypothetical protein